MSKVAFFYCCGTVSTTADFSDASGLEYNQPGTGSEDFSVISGLNGLTALWNGAPTYDPFPMLLDPEIFEPRKKIAYKASSTGFTGYFLNPELRTMGQSIEDGITKVVAEITSLPAGQKFMLGGFSQGAAVMSGCYQLGLKPGTTGVLESYRDRFLGYTGFGNPRRQVNYRGSVGGTWSGAFDIPGSSTGGHGSFPSTGPYARLTNCEPLKWIDFANEDDIITSVGDSAQGQGWVAGNNVFLGTATATDWLTYLASLPVIAAAVTASMSFANGVVPNVYDAVGNLIAISGMGHVTYPLVPPPGNPDNNLTSYQIAIKFLTAKANEYAVAPIVLPSLPSAPSSAGWSTTLVPPAA